MPIRYLFYQLLICNILCSIEGHNYRMYSYVVSFYTKAVRLMELLEMVLPEEHVRNLTCVKSMGAVIYLQVHYKNNL